MVQVVEVGTPSVISVDYVHLVFPSAQNQLQGTGTHSHLTKIPHTLHTAGTAWTPSFVI